LDQIAWLGGSLIAIQKLWVDEILVRPFAVYTERTE